MGYSARHIEAWRRKLLPRRQPALLRDRAQHRPEKVGHGADIAQCSRAMALPPTKRPEWLAAAEGLESFKLADTTSGRRRFVQRPDREVLEEEGSQCGVPTPLAVEDRRRSDLRRGWYWGSQAFAERPLGLGAKGLGSAQGRQTRGTPEQRAHGEWENGRPGVSSLKVSLARASPPPTWRHHPGASRERWPSPRRSGRRRR